MTSKLLSSACVIFLKLPFSPRDEKNQLAHFKKFKRDSQGYKVLYFVKDQGKSLGPMIPSKGLQGVLWHIRRTQLSPRVENAVPDLIIFSAPEEIFFWLAVPKPIVLTSPHYIHSNKSAASSLT